MVQGNQQPGYYVVNQYSRTILKLQLLRYTQLLVKYSRTILKLQLLRLSFRLTPKELASQLVALS